MNSSTPTIYAEYTSWTAAQAVYTHGPETDDPLIRSSQSQTIYYHRDGLGNVVATSDPGGNIVGARTYDAWGNTLAQTGTIPQYGYTGREPDATGFVYYRARYYDPSIGRFISRDPAGMPDGINQYAYVGNDPINATDPSGEILNFIGGAIANVAIGGAIRMATGGSFWDAGGIATDLAVGAATSGVGALASLRHLRNLENAVASGTRFTGSVQGVAQVTGKGTNVDHGVRSVFEAQKLVKSQGGTAYLDASVSKVGISGTAKNYRPDVTHVAKNGGINTVEVASVSQQSGAPFQCLMNKTADIRQAVTSRGGTFSGEVIHPPCLCPLGKERHPQGCRQIPTLAAGKGGYAV